MRIFGTKPSSVILSQTKKFQKLESGILKVTKQAKQEYREMFETQKSGSKTSSGAIGLNIKTDTSTSWSQNGWCNKPTKLQFQSISTRKKLMLSKRYKSTEVDRRTWPHVPSGTQWSTSSDTHQVIEI